VLFIPFVISLRLNGEKSIKLFVWITVAYAGGVLDSCASGDHVASRINDETNIANELDIRGSCDTGGLYIFIHNRIAHS